MNLLLPTLVKRLTHASSVDLVPLLEIPGMKHVSCNNETECFAFRHTRCACGVPTLPIVAVSVLCSLYRKGRARQLYSLGYRTPQHLAQATAKELVDSVEHLYHSAAQTLIREAKV